jgi:hypothetical protein
VDTTFSPDTPGAKINNKSENNMINFFCMLCY